MYSSKITDGASKCTQEANEGGGEHVTVLPRNTGVRQPLPQITF